MTEYYTDDDILHDMMEDLDNQIEPELWDVLDTYVSNLQDLMMIMVRRLNVRPERSARYMREADHYIDLFKQSIVSLGELRDVAFDEDDLRMANAVIDESMVAYGIEIR